MSVALMNLLGGAATLSAEGGSDKASLVSPLQQGAEKFDAIMAANALKDVSAETLRAFFKSHGVAVPELARDGAQTAGEVLAKVMAMRDGEKLPGELVLALQDMFLPADAGLSMQLPARELTPEELSELVQETGLSPVVILALLQDTPAASPNLAVALVDGASDEAAQALQSSSGQVQADIARMTAAMMQQGLARDEAAQLATQLVAVEAMSRHVDKHALLERAAAVMRGEKLQGEFDWDARPQAQAAGGAQGKPAEGRPQGMTEQSALLKRNIGVQSNTEAAKAAEQVLVQKPSPVGQEAAGGAKNAQQPQADTPLPQQANFSTLLEQGTALRGLNQTAGLEAQLRHPVLQGGPVLEQVEVRLRQAVADGGRSMEIQLKPAELGRVSVRIDTDMDGRSHVTVTADKRDTLEMLQRDARGLERALQDAGLKTDSNSLSFNLRGEDQQQAQNGKQGKSQQGKFTLHDDYADDIESKLDASGMALTYDAGRGYRLNLDWGVDISV